MLPPKNAQGENYKWNLTVACFKKLKNIVAMKSFFARNQANPGRYHTLLPSLSSKASTWTTSPLPYPTVFIVKTPSECA